MPISRRRMIQWMAAAMPTALVPRLPQGRAGRSGAISAGRFTGSWESLKQYQAPEWFRDAKFGIWAHWTAQCVPEQGDGYARRMYLQGDPAYTFHVQNYGHPSAVGFMEINHRWKADAWDPASLMDLYVKAGAKYFVALANHHDNFDCFDSTHHGWNSVRIGPKKDIVGTWAALARARGLTLRRDQSFPTCLALFATRLRLRPRRAESRWALRRRWSPPAAPSPGTHRS